jgi:hypothetical protein
MLQLNSDRYSVPSIHQELQMLEQPKEQSHRQIITVSVYPEQKLVSFKVSGHLVNYEFMKI